MADKLEVDAQRFRTAATKTGDVRDKVTTILDTLQRAIDSRGTPWGNDSIGDQFANGEGGKGGYLASRTNMITGGRNVAGTMGNFHDAQTKSADYLERMDHGNGDGYR
ncbi:hypothetical protein [Nocardia pseudobrasiliensis]|uniref:WXG100 family type VII secretion target n=1 Tax=Nocardia pseudobrasiliensis TaxID=45979 RepID=A0A370I1B7_9NOCA|nr:hypothetical protein [Nocardia pseudobrasiliensis]RDI64529.1 hypothetical protein DFR76_108362 [Nocardia pseudobrasiliensis]